MLGKGEKFERSKFFFCGTRYRGVSVRGSLLDARRPVKIIIHGFLQNYRSPWIVELTQALLQRAAANTRVVGAEVARLITLLGQRKAISARNVHIIGHSLGAHVAGEAGRQLQDTLGRISGLDPADPNFSFQPTEVRLDPSDARWVDVIHTDGAPTPLTEPGCHSDASVFSFVQDAYHEGMTNAEYAMACSHDRSVRLYIESVTSSCPFTAYPCDSAEDFNAGRCLRCGYHYMVHVTLGDDMSSTHGVLHVHIVGDNGETPSLELYRGDMYAGDVITRVMLAPHDVGHVTGLRMRMYFCPDSPGVSANQPVELQNGNRQPGPCFQQ
nr:hypothetical protein BaRGS_023513 [Batillaria attramentaria]